MPVDRLSSLSTLMAALRSEVSRKSDRPLQSIPAKTVDRPGEGKANARHDTEALRKQVAAIVRGVDATDPDAVGKARTQMIRAMLLWEYGPQIREHAEWQPMLEALNRAIESSPALSDEFLRLIADMR